MLKSARAPELGDPRGEGLVARAAEELGIEIARARGGGCLFHRPRLGGKGTRENPAAASHRSVSRRFPHLEGPLLRDWDFWVEVGYRPGVTDNVGLSASEGIADLLDRTNGSERTVFVATAYAIEGTELNREAVDRIARDLLANNLIEEVIVHERPELSEGASFAPRIPRVHLPKTPAVQSYDLDISDDELMQLSRDNTWALTLVEMQAIAAHFKSSAIQKQRNEKGLPEAPHRCRNRMPCPNLVGTLQTQDLWKQLRVPRRKRGNAPDRKPFQNHDCRDHENAFKQERLAGLRVPRQRRRDSADG